MRLTSVRHGGSLKAAATVITARGSGPASHLLPRSFYARPTLEVAEDLLGKILVHRTRAGVTAGRIVEVEAYVGESDAACHAAPGPTKRNEPLYGPPGHAYVYLNYGVHYLVNVVTESNGSPAAVLLRALEPIEGLSLMRARRSRARTARHARLRTRFADHLLCSGPGNVTHAMGISLRQNRIDLVGETLYIEDRGHRPVAIGWSPRIGITKAVDRPWRCYDSENRSVSAQRANA
jgi:DNA-3-methyladenine glycosylase